MNDQDANEVVASLLGVPVDRIRQWQFVNDDGRAVVQVQLMPEVEMIENIEVKAAPTPEPVPEWRRLVDDMARILDGESPPLTAVLTCLAAIANSESPEGYLAEIVAVCEQQVGDGWRAETGSAIPPEDPIWWLLESLDLHTWADPYRVTALRAASWLATLTGESA